MRLSLVPDDIIGGLYPMVSLEKYRMQKKKLKDHKKNHESGQDDNDLAMTPPSVNKISNNFRTSAVPQNSPGQPRKSQNGSNTIEDLNKKMTKTAVSSKGNLGMRSDAVEDNNSDDEMQVEASETASSKMTSRLPKSSSNDGEDAILRQLLPKNRRVTSGRRTASASGGVRKISGTIKK